MRNKTSVVKIKDILIGGGNPVVVQTMTKTFTQDVESTVKQIKEIEDVGCKLVRVAVPDFEAVSALKEIKKQVNAAVVADVHFNYKIAIEAIKNGADKIRINPANIGGIEKLKEVIKVAKDYNIPIRLGFNAGSYKKKLEKASKKILSEADKFVDIFESLNFKQIVISAKTADVLSTVDIYMNLAKKYRYPLHLGITEAGPLLWGAIKSAVGLGILLWQGIGDTIRVSLSSSPIDEVRVGYFILQCLELGKYGVDLISCPTCGRTQVNLLKIIEEFQKKLKEENLEYKPVKVAIMGCEVNGPGEAASADIGIAMGKNSGVLFVKGKIIKKVSFDNCINELLEYIKKL